MPATTNRAAGLTLLEVLLAVAITSIIATAVATMLLSVSSASSYQATARGFVVRHAAASGRIDPALRCARMVLDHGNGYFVLWIAETTPNGQPDLSELRRLEHDANSGEIRCYEAAGDLAAEDDTTFDLDAADFEAETRPGVSADWVGNLLVTDVIEWTTWLNHADPRRASYVGYRITTAVEGEQRTTIHGTFLRNE